MRRKFYKKYLGNYMSVYCGIAGLFLVILPAFLAVYLWLQMGMKSLLLVIFFMIGMIFLAVVYVSLANHFWSYGYFESEQIRVKCIFRKEFVIQYTDCVDVGVGYYNHRTFLPGFSPVIKYIYFSSTLLSEEQRTAINLVKPSKTFIKLGYNRKNYEDLLCILPTRQATMLKNQVDLIERK